MVSIVKLVLQKFGEVAERSEREVVTTIEECYRRLAPHEVEILNLLLFMNSSEMKFFYSHERSALGVTSGDFSDQFFAMHEAWTGTSRIAVCMDRMRKIPRIVQVGALRHEVGHSVLHGSLEYYVFPLTRSLIDISMQFGVSNDYLFSLLYLISIAVKDFEVTKLLVKNGYIEDQVAYSSYVSATSKQDTAAWTAAGSNHASKGLCLAGRLKDTMCFVALQPEIGEAQIERRLRKEFSYMGKPILEKTLTIAKKLPQAMVDDTFRNVSTATSIFVESLLIPIFNRTVS